jgi:hypothetical protein
MPNANDVNEQAQFRAAIQEQLRDAGTYDEITASVRSRLLLSLQNSPNQRSTTAKRDSVEDVAVQSLIYQFLEQQSLKHTLSVFSAESGLDTRLPLSPDKAIKALGLGAILKDLSAIEDTNATATALSTILRVVPQLNAKQMLTSPTNVTRTISKSVQTEVDCNIKGNSKPLPSNVSMEQRLIEIERNCEQRMRAEMNEKLKLSAKRQAIHAMRRLEEKHKEEIKVLRLEMKDEKARSTQIRDDLVEKLSNQQLSMQKERSDNDNTLQKILLEKQTLESEIDLINERVRETQQRRLKDWTDERDKMTQAYAKLMNELEEQQRCLQRERNDIARQHDATHATEMMCSMLEKDRVAWISERESLLAENSTLTQQKGILHQSLSKSQAARARQDQEQLIKEESFQQERSTTRYQLLNVQDKYESVCCDLDRTMLELENSRNEVTALRSLLKQSQSALECISFRDDGQRNMILEKEKTTVDSE